MSPRPAYLAAMAKPKAVLIKLPIFRAFKLDGKKGELVVVTCIGRRLEFPNHTCLPASSLQHNIIKVARTASTIIFAAIGASANYRQRMTKNQPVSILEEVSVPCHTPSSEKPSETLDIRIITHNIRYATKSPFQGEEPWPIRCPRLCSQFKFNSLQPSTIICLQEVLHTQLKDILRSLNESENQDNQWSYIGVGRDDGKEAGEYSPIFYRPSVWRLEMDETRWLSPTPEKVIIPIIFPSRSSPLYFKYLRLGSGGSIFPRGLCY